VSSTIESVREFWDANPCGSAASRAADRREYFEEIRRKRYASEWHIPLVARFEEFRGKDVLEIGCGLGTDGLEFARNGARYTGVDLSPRSVELAREHFDLFGAEGEFLVADAERLPFADESCDHVYSFGVIHHSPDIEAIVREIERVLRPGGTFTVMVYNGSSINYRLEIMLLRRLFRLALYPRAAPRLLAPLLRIDRVKLEDHRRLLLERRRVSREEWVSMNTDGPECPLARVYSARGAIALFREFADVRTEAWFFNEEHWPLVGRVLPAGLRRTLGRRFGWHRMIYGRKPGATA
jgi:SAM-dependent methyltransferase